MTDATQEALNQSLRYHSTLHGAAMSFTAAGKVKAPSPEQIIATAKKFEAFLLEKRSGKA